MFKIALLPGHNGVKGVGDCGASTVIATEFDVVKDVVSKVWKSVISQTNSRVYLIHRGIDKGSYSKLPSELNEIGPDLIIEVHLNAASNTAVQGSEVLYWNTSKKGKEYASIIQKHLVNEIGSKDRGLKPLTTDDRGANLLKNTKAPAVIVEGFFLTGCSSETQLVELANKYVIALEKAILEIINKNNK